MPWHEEDEGLAEDSDCSCEEYVTAKRKPAFILGKDGKPLVRKDYRHEDSTPLTWVSSRVLGEVYICHNRRDRVWGRRILRILDYFDP